MVKSSSGRSPHSTIQVDEVEEVAELMTVENQLRELIESNKEFYDRLVELVNLRNEKLEMAEKHVRSLGMSCGPFIKLSESQKINAEKLFEEIGADNFQNVGGYTEVVTAYKVDRARFLSIAQRGDIPKPILDEVLKTEVRFKKPDPYKLP